MTREELAEHLCVWLDKERVHFLAVAMDYDIAPSKMVRRVRGRIEGDNAMYVGEEYAVASPLADVPTLDLVYQVAGHAKEPPTKLLLETFGDRCLTWLIPEGSTGPEVEARMTDLYLEPVRLSYARQLRSLAVPEPELSQRLVEDLLDFLERNDLQLVITLPVSGIRPPIEPVRCKDVTIRALSGDELGKLHWHDEGPRIAPRVSAPLRLLDTFWETTAIVVELPASKRQQPSGTYRMQRVVLALDLLGFELSGKGDAPFSTAPGPSLLFAGTVIELARAGGNPRPCPLEQLEEAVALADLIPDQVFEGPRSREAVSLHRFLLGASEYLASEALIDFVIALESLFAQEHGSELSYRFRLNGARFLGSTLEERERLFSDLKEVYDLRSRLVHGDTPPSSEALANGRARARDLAARSIIKALREGWPNAEDFKRWTLA